MSERTRPAMRKDPVELVLTTTREVVLSLDQLVEAGLYGFTREDAATRLLEAKVRELLRDGWLQR